MKMLLTILLIVGLFFFGCISEEKDLSQDQAACGLRLNVTLTPQFQEVVIFSTTEILLLKHIFQVRAVLYKKIN